MIFMSVIFINMTIPFIGRQDAAPTFVFINPKFYLFVIIKS